MENNRIALLRSVTPTSSPSSPSIQRPLLVTAARSLTNLQLQPSSSSPQLSVKMDNPLIRRTSTPGLIRAVTRPATPGSLSPQMSTRPTPSARISLAQSSRSSPFGTRQILPAQLMSPTRSKDSHCLRPSARFTPQPTPRIQSMASASSSPPGCQEFCQTDYEVPEHNRVIMNKLIHQYRGLSIEYHLSNPLEQKVRNEFYVMRDDLLKNATMHLTDIITSQKRPDTPALAINDSPYRWIEKIYKKYAGMVLGEFHGDSGSKRFLIKNMSILKKQGVRTLYLEHLLSDLHHNELESYFSPKMKKMPSGLKNYLEGLNRGFHVRSKYNFLTLIESAKDNGIRVMAIDAAASYHTDKENPLKNCRIHMMNYYAQGVINGHQKIAQGKWIALVGNQHANTFENIPGLAELTNGIGIRVKETRCKTTVIQPDNGEILLSASSNGPAMEYNFIKSDFVLTTPDKKIYNTVTKTDEIEKRLKTGFFTIDTERLMLKHRSREGSVVNTSLNKDSDGAWFITKPEWKRINNKRYMFIQDLVNDLETTMGMKLIYSL